MTGNDVYADTAERWDEFVALARRAGVFGFDTEFHGVDVTRQSCVGRAVVHVFSAAVPTGELHPRGYSRCRRWVFPGVALHYPPLRGLLEDEGVRKEVHNQSVDSHALANHGVTLRGGRNTLGLVRWRRPELVNQAGRFQLKSLMTTLLGREPVCTYRELVSFKRPVTLTREKRVSRVVCSCGETGCRKRKGHDKSTVTETVLVERVKIERGEYPLESILPGHERWDLLVEYAAEDAVAALQIAELADETKDPAPFPFAPHRPGFSQAVEECVIEMERVGIPVDRPWATARVATADEMEEAELQWLARWYVLNAPAEGPHRREEIDEIWSSPTKKLALFDALEFPRSPVWAKGRVKNGEAKMDWKAMEWIATNHLPSKPLLEHLLQLQRIRSGRKYLTKLRDSSGMIHPVCGPAGDDDERAGAVTGRLGVKGELEAQQLPKEGQKDLFGVRRGIIAEGLAA